MEKHLYKIAGLSLRAEALVILPCNIQILFKRAGKKCVDQILFQSPAASFSKIIYTMNKR